MTNEQLYIAIGVPAAINAVLLAILFAYINAKFESVNAKFESVNVKFEGVNSKIEALNKRFDDMGDLWRAELYRVEGVIDARLKHLEESR